MATQRLTKTIKDEILNKMLASLFKPREAAIVERRKDLAEKVYEKHYSKANRELMEKAPAEAFISKDSVKVDFSALCSYAYLPLRKNRRFFYADAYAATIEIDSKSDLGKEYTFISATEDKMKEERIEISRKTRALLNSCTTVKKLVEVWPEVTEYLPKMQENTNLPAVPVPEINAMIAKLKAAAGVGGDKSK